MHLAEYPRPPGDTGIGFHWHPEVWFNDPPTLARFLPELKAMGTSWLCVICALDRFPREFLEGLIQNRIEPIVRIEGGVGPIDQTQLLGFCRQYTAVGGHYLHVYNEPNLREEWGQWDANALPERFMNHLLPALETMASVDGLIPVFTPLAPGGHYWDLPFLETCLRLIVQKKKEHLFDRLAIGIHNYAFNRLPTYGRGGRAVWPCARDYEQRPGCEDQAGFWLFEWYDEIVRGIVGRSLPMICGENGALLGSAQDPGRPAVDEALHAQRTSEMAQLLMSDQCPPYVFNNAFWLLVAKDGTQWTKDRWYNADGAPRLTRTIGALKGLAKRAKKGPWTLPPSIRVLMPEGKVVRMELEEYLKGVVPKEMGIKAPVEALKAQAVAARCYAVRAVQSPRHSEADICTTTHCQVWGPERYPPSDAAVEATRGVVATYGRDVIGAYFFGHCNGSTRNSEDVWVSPLPYTRATWCPCGYGERNGHGVGMCQRGAMAMAGMTASYERILKHYYRGIGLVALGPPGLAPAPRWRMRVERGSLGGVIAGSLPQGGVAVTVRDASGRAYSALSGSSPRFGAGGFEISLDRPGRYAVSFLDQAFQVEVNQERLTLTFALEEGT